MKNVKMKVNEEEETRIDKGSLAERLRFMADMAEKHKCCVMISVNFLEPVSDIQADTEAFAIVGDNTGEDAVLSQCMENLADVLMTADWAEYLYGVLTDRLLAGALAAEEKDRKDKGGYDEKDNA